MVLSLPKIANDQLDFPEAWCDFCQVHLPKHNVQNQQHCPVDKLRPIVIESALWRVAASTWVKRTATQTWIRNWIPNEAFGGIAKRSVDDVSSFHTEFLNLSAAAVVSLDLAKCFDYVSVPLALRCLQKLGMPQPMFGVTRKGIWCASEIPSLVGNSLPQGDALLVIALLAVLSMPTLDIRPKAQQDGEYVRMITFVDDRSFLTRDAPYAMTMIQRWTDWSQVLGLVENQHKIAVVARPAAREAMLERGAQQQCFVDSARILGIDFGLSQSPERPIALARVNETLRRVTKTSFFCLWQLHSSSRCWQRFAFQKLLGDAVFLNMHGFNCRRQLTSV